MTLTKTVAEATKTVAALTATVELQTPPRSVLQLYPQPYFVYCDTFTCRQVAKWQTGRPDGPPHNNQHFCQTCADHLIRYLPLEAFSRDVLEALFVRLGTYLSNTVAAATTTGLETTPKIAITAVEPDSGLNPDLDSGSEDERPFKCSAPDCDYATKREALLVTHMQKKHKMAYKREK